MADSLALKVLGLLESNGAMFASDIEHESGLLRPQLEQALKTLIAAGAIGGIIRAGFMLYAALGC